MGKIMGLDGEERRAESGEWRAARSEERAKGEGGGRMKIQAGSIFLNRAEGEGGGRRIGGNFEDVNEKQKEKEKQIEKLK